MDPPYDIKLVFVQKIASVLRKINKYSCHQSCLHFLTQIGIKSFVGWGFAPDPIGGAYSAPPDLLAGFKGPYS